MSHKILHCPSPRTGKEQRVRITTYKIDNGKFIELQAGCSFAELDRETALAVAVALNDAVAEYDRMNAEERTER